jgi:hypothetical protein
MWCGELQVCTYQNLKKMATQCNVRNLQKEEHSSGRTDGNNLEGHEPIIAKLLDLMETVQVGLSLPVRLSKKKTMVVFP